MMDTIMSFALTIRARIMRILKPTDSYWFATKTVKPLSRKFGIDRGTPIDRFYIDQFIKGNNKCIKGVCLEIGDDRYISQFGKGVTRTDVLDIVPRKKVTVIADLRSMPHVKSNTYDCIILTQVLGMIDDLDSVISELYRVLKKGGVLLITTSALSPCIDYDLSFWRFTVASLRYILAKQFDNKKILVKSYGNALTSQLFYVGGVQEDIDMDKLSYNDKYFPTIIVAKGVK